MLPYAYSLPSIVRRGLLGAGFGTEGDGYAVPGVDGGDGPGQIGQFLVGEMGGDGVVDGVGDVAVGDVGQGLGPFQRGSLAVGVVAGFAPGIQAVEASSLSPTARASFQCMSMQ